ncbi:MAG TPA: MBL fold metallo-hydrolase [Burkholderiales bacterium]|nr:MBL fold metallo-hydrolase [Burkholderiales bacterium]
MRFAPLREFDHGICAIDAGFKRPLLASIHLLREGRAAALIDIGTNHSVPNVLAALAAKGVAATDVRYLILTHVHLDHAGGAGEMLRHLPNAEVVIHPRGARHMVDPARLVAGAQAVYGDAVFRRDYGDIVPIPADRVIETRDEFVLDLNGRPLVFLDTPGHARHHHCVYDARSASFFTGDCFGISYRELDVGDEECIFPTTTPTQFDPVAAHATIDRLIGYAPSQMFLTHYSRVAHVPRLADDLHELIDAHAALAERARNAGAERDRLLEAGVRDLLLGHVSRHGCALDRDAVLDVIGMDIMLNAQGLAAWLDSNRASLSTGEFPAVA